MKRKHLNAKHKDLKYTSRNPQSLSDLAPFLLS